MMISTIQKIHVSELTDREKDELQYRVLNKAITALEEFNGALYISCVRVIAKLQGMPVVEVYNQIIDYYINHMVRSNNDK